MARKHSHKTLCPATVNICATTKLCSDCLYNKILNIQGNAYGRITDKGKTAKDYVTAMGVHGKGDPFHFGSIKIDLPCNSIWQLI